MAWFRVALLGVSVAARRAAVPALPSGLARSIAPRVLHAPILPISRAYSVAPSLSDEPTINSDYTDGPEVSSFRISAHHVDRLAAAGIARFFPIQAKTFDIIYDGQDVIGRANTGTGKTLSFALPVIERLANSMPTQRKHRPPRAIVVVPTRELAKQVAKEFELATDVLSVTTVYGGVAYAPQEEAFRNGVDVVVGTPGRLLDHIQKGAIKLDQVQFLIMDEADNMLDRGFAKDVERLAEEMPVERQTLLFSATIPPWVKDISRKFLRNPVTVDLVGQKQRSSPVTVSHFAVRVHPSSRVTCLADILTMYMKERAIIFTNTKLEANILMEADALREDARVLHGDVSQTQRELTLQAFRDGKVRLLIATDVAARGLDIPAVDLVVQYEVPRDTETYIHRSGRCGRAGRSGKAVTLHSGRNDSDLREIENRVGIKFVRTSAPTRDEVMKAMGAFACNKLQSVEPGMLRYFMSSAEELLREQGPSALAAALAVVSGQIKELGERSLLSAREGYTVVQLSSPQIHNLAGFQSIVRRLLPNVAVNVHPCVDGSAVIDVPEQSAQQIVANARSFNVEARLVKSDMPALTESSDGFGSSGRFGNRSFGGGNRGSFGGRGGSRGSFGGENSGSFGSAGSRGSSNARNSGGGFSGGSGGFSGGNRGSGGFSGGNRGSGGNGSSYAGSSNRTPFGGSSSGSNTNVFSSFGGAARSSFGGNRRDFSSNQ